MSNTETKKRQSICKKSFINADGGHAANPVTDAGTGVHFAFANGVGRTVQLAELPNAIVNALALHGIRAKLGDVYAGAGGDASKAVEWFDDTLSMLESGEWSERAEPAGPSASLVAQAVAASIKARGANHPKPWTADDDAPDSPRMTKIIELHQSKEARAERLKDPAVKAQYERLRAERAMARANAAMTAAANAPQGDLDSL